MSEQTTEHTAKEMAEAASINDAIDAMTDVVIEAGLVVGGETDDGPMAGVLVAEGVLARIIAAFAKAYGGGEQAGLDDLLEISGRHIRELAQSYWNRLEDEAASETTEEET